MDEQGFWHTIVAINLANLAANLESLAVNREILARARGRDAEVASLLQEIRDELRGGEADGG